MLQMLEYDFMQRAVIAALLTGLAAPAIGTYLVQRRLALLGDGIGHIALTGVAVGLLTETAPLLTAVVVAALGAIVIELLRAYGRTSGDVALALLFYGGIAGGVLLTNLAGDSAAKLNGFLFGAITTVSDSDLRIVWVLAVVVLLVALGLAPQLFAVCQDEEYARVTGVPVRAYGLLIAVLAAVTVTVSMRTVGLLLVSALMVVPVATAQQVTRSFRATFGIAMVLGVIASVFGVGTSFEYDTSPGPTIVLIALAFFIVTSPLGALVRSARRRRAPFDPVPVTAHVPIEEHPHEHGDDCGHTAVPHGDHVDYIHGGHRHAAHGAHYDEH
ncbi:MAG TPA: metal ABC transporter permease [Nocardioidaceae bacterium]|nr:metal ABC transporter permease [Nocardioidaceae bacterium]